MTKTYFDLLHESNYKSAVCRAAEKLKEEATRMIKDSGNRREFDSGAVRDMAEGKGRCDLMPLDVVGRILGGNRTFDEVFLWISKFKETNDGVYLYRAIEAFTLKRGWNNTTMLLEVAKHFEEGCKKYGEDNWRKGIPVKCYIDSAVRHYLKWLRGDEDEPHDRAFCWNVMCCIWTYEHLEKEGVE